MVSERAALSGGAVLASGEIALIVDCDALGAHRRNAVLSTTRAGPGLERNSRPMSTHFTDMQLDALRELANIGSGTASTSLSSMLRMSGALDELGSSSSRR